MGLGQLLAGALVLAQSAPGPFIGPATCNATSCHGATRSDSAAAARGARIGQDEYPTWFLRDPHRKAMEALSSPLAKTMGERLGVDVARAAECLTCHAVPDGAAHASSGAEPGDPRLAEFGVSCEACHGAASGWYGSHFQQGFDRAAAVANLGLRDLRDPAQLAATCSGCHVSNATRVVDHRLIAAGHPDLAFEMGRFLLRVPAHWRDRGAESRAWRQRAALVGQAVALREQMKRVARDAAAVGADVVDFSNLDCASCHHDLAGDGWQALRDYRLARARPTPLGRPLFDGARIVTTSAIAAAAGPELAAALRGALAQVEAAAADPDATPATLRAAAEAAAAACDRAIAALAGLADPDAAIAAATAALAQDAELVAAQGAKGAAQAAGLLLVLRDGSAAAIERELLAPLAAGAAFDPAAFARSFAALAQGK